MKTNRNPSNPEVGSRDNPIFQTEFSRDDKESKFLHEQILKENQRAAKQNEEMLREYKQEKILQHQQQDKRKFSQLTKVVLKLLFICFGLFYITFLTF